MSLDPRTSHPSSRSYVLKLHRDARPQDSLLFGRLESLATGHCFVFASAGELLDCLARDALAALRDAAASQPHHD